MPDSNTDTENRPAPRPRRKWPRIVAISLAFLLVVSLSFPLWSAWLAPPLASWLADVEMVELDSSSTRWHARGVSFHREGVSFQAQSIEIPSPTGWLLAQTFLKRENLGVAVDKWTLKLEPTEPPPESGTTPPTPHALFNQVNQAFELIHKQLGEIRASDGEITSNGKRLAHVSRVSVTRDNATIEAEIDPTVGQASLELDRSAPDSWHLRLVTDSPEATLDATVARTEQALAIEGDLQAFQNEMQLSARWEADAELGPPTHAMIVFDALGLDHQRFEFWPENLPLDLQAELVWSDSLYRFDIQSLDTARLQDRIEHHIDLAGSGDLSHARIESANIQLPWLTAENNAPLEFDFSLENPLSDAALEMMIDFREFPWVEGSGRLDTSLTVSTSDAGQPIARLVAQSDHINLYDTTISEIDMRFELVGKRLNLRSLNAQTENGSHVSAQGAADLATSQIEGLSIEATLQNESDRLKQLFPIAQWQTLDLRLAANGAFSDPRVDLDLAADEIKLPSLNPLDIRLVTEGHLSSLQTALQARRQDHQFDFIAHVNYQPDRVQAAIETIRIAQSGEPLLQTSAPATVEFDMASGALGLTDFQLQGPNNAVIAITSFRLDANGLSGAGGAQNVSTALLDPWLETSPPPLEVEAFTADVLLAPENSQIDLAMKTYWQLDDDNTIEASLVASQSASDEPQLEIERLEVGAAGHQFFEAKGRFPLSLGWIGNRLDFSIRETAPIALTINSSPHPSFWESLSDLIPVSIERPVISANFEGSLEKPQGSASVEVESIRWTSPQFPDRSVVLSEILVNIGAEPDRVEVTSASAKLGKNSIQASGAANFKGAQLDDLLSKHAMPRLTDYEAAITLDATDLEAAQAWLPEFVRTQGQLRLEANLAPDDIQATASFSNLATRPMPPLGSFAEIKGNIHYDNGRVVVRSLDGLAEQNPFKLDGSVDLSDPANPVYDLAFVSKEFPLTRTTGILIEGDVDLRLISKDSPEPNLEGSIQLTKGLILTQPELMANTTKSSKQRPPYFSVQDEPFNEWGLNVTISGDKFLRVSNSFFQGTLSADFLLDGTLENPLLIGKATTDAGRIFFPATSLTVSSAEVFITRERPSEIQINAAAEGSLYEYQINLAIEGALEDPEIDVTTNPAMSQTEALVFVTTGALPDQGDLAKQSASSIGLFIGKGLFRKLLSSDSGGGERLRLEVGRDTSEQGKKTIEAGYQLTEDLEVEGEYDKHDEYNANLKWTFFER